MPRRRRLSPGFDGCAEFEGRPLLTTETDEEYQFYLTWLADYLYRPTAETVPLDYEEARGLMWKVSGEMETWLFNHPGEEYPTPAKTDPNGQAHVDCFHRPEISAGLSAFEDRSERIRLLDRMYQGFWDDAMK